MQRRRFLFRHQNSCCRFEKNKTNIIKESQGSMATKTYWIFRRPSTKEEVQNIIDKSFEPDETSKAIEDLMIKVYGDKGTTETDN